jgi:hypothetical protein
MSLDSRISKARAIWTALRTFFSFSIVFARRAFSFVDVFFIYIGP